MKKQLIALLLAALLCLSACAVRQEPTQTEPQQTQPQVYHNPYSAQEVTEQMKIGWSLGNTFDAPDGETAWGMPFTTPEMIEKVYDMGFRTLRLPVSWGKHTDGAPDYRLDEAWLARVETVIDCALELGMYVIVNAHHDLDYYMPTAENEENAVAYIRAIWQQVAERFADRDYHLIFETMNEPRVEGASYEWWVDTESEGCMQAIDIINRLNQTALDAIRAAGGWNSERFVMVPSYAANSQGLLIDRFHLPEDTAEGKLIVSVHAYSPYDLCLNVNSPQTQFRSADFNDVISMMKSLNYRYVKKGIPVVIGEMGCINKNNPDDRYAWAKAYVAAAREYGMICCVWDNGVTTGAGELFGILDRRTCSVFEASQSYLQGLMDGLTA